MHACNCAYVHQSFFHVITIRTHLRTTQVEVGCQIRNRKSSYEDFNLRNLPFFKNHRYEFS